MQEQINKFYNNTAATNEIEKIMRYISAISDPKLAEIKEEIIEEGKELLVHLAKFYDSLENLIEATKE